MTKAELESKHLSELHALAAEAGIAKYRMLARGELIDQLSDGEAGAGRPTPPRAGSGRSAQSRSDSQGSRSDSQGGGDRPRRRRRRSSGGGGGDELGDEALSAGSRPPRGDRAPRQPRKDRQPRQDREPAEGTPAPVPPPAPTPPAAEGETASRPRRRRRRRFGRRGKDGVTIQDLLLPPAAGRQAIICAATREGCTALLRGVAADLAAAAKGPDPVVLLIDPSPEELAEWKREAPQAEIVAAGQARHASDALAQAAKRSGEGEDVMLLVDSLSRLTGDFGDADTAKQFFDAGRAQGPTGGGSLTVVAALERPTS
jgi:hypothetical protein